MALKQKLVTNNIPANYWRIVGYTISMTGKLAQIFMVGYLDETTRLEGLNIVSRNYMITNENFDKYVQLKDGVHVADLYGYLKNETDDFKGASDILDSGQAIPLKE